MSETYTGPSEAYYKEKAEKDKRSKFTCMACDNVTYGSGFTICKLTGKFRKHMSKCPEGKWCK